MAHSNWLIYGEQVTLTVIVSDFKKCCLFTKLTALVTVTPTPPAQLSLRPVGLTTETALQIRKVSLLSGPGTGQLFALRIASGRRYQVILHSTSLRSP